MDMPSTDTSNTRIVIASNFTAGAVDKALHYCLTRLQLPASIEHAPYDQVFQQLLEPGSLLNNNRSGINIVLLRLQGWLENSREGNGDATSQSFDSVVQDLIRAVASALEQSSAQLIVCLCPAAGLADDAVAIRSLRLGEEAIARAFESVPGATVLTSADLLRRYPVTGFCDQHGIRIANIPYRAEFFSVLGTALARAVNAVVFPAHKVIVFDCDGTLWGGLCGESGATGVVITQEHREMQMFAAQQRRTGKLICLASRNNETDVLDVFDRNTSMVLTRNDLTAWQVNWGLKSDSLAQLSTKLGLGLDSFVFIDDDPMQCAEVRRRYPEVLALQMPAQGVANFCQHIWPLDNRSVTQESGRRTAAYREHVAREDVRETSLSFKDFLESLELNVVIAALHEQDLARASELTLRTNQFNLTGLRITEAEFRHLVLRDGGLCFGVRVKDRFGDYGLVGLLVCERDEDALRASVFLLSCRALGRGVEHRMLAYLGQLARDKFLDRVVLRCARNAKNRPAVEFLEQLAAQTTDDQELVVELTAGAAAATVLDADATPKQREVNPTTRSISREGAGPFGRMDFLAAIPSALANPETIHRAIESAASPGKADSPGSAGDPVRAMLVKAFSDELGVPMVDVDAGFFDLGGHSLQAVRILAQASSEFDIELDATLLFTTNFSIAELAEEIGFLRSAGKKGMTGVLEQLAAITDR